MKVLATAALLMAKKYGMSVDDTEQLVAGLIDGLVDADDFEYIKVCLKDATGVEQLVEKAVADFEKGDVQSILDGIVVIGQILQDLPTDLGDCEAIKPDIARIENWATIFEDPKKLASTVLMNLLTHHQKIFDDVSQTSRDFDSSQFHAAGVDISDILIQTLGPVPKLAATEITAIHPENLLITQWGQ